MYNVLLADDETAILEGLKTIICWNELGLNLVAAVTDGESALQYIRENPVDILVTDIRMKEMDGLALISALHEVSPETRCIILTGYSDFGYTKKAIQLGIENYILKPVDENELVLTLTNLITKLEEDASKARNSIYEFRDAICYRWITGKIDINAFQHRAGVLDIDLTEKFFQVGVLRVRNYELLTQNDSIACEKNVLRVICSELRHVKQARFAVCRGERGDFLAALWGSLDLCREELKRAFIRAGQVLSGMRLNAVSSLGKLQEDFMQLSASYTDAMFLVEFGLILPAGTVADEYAVSCLMNEKSKPMDVDPQELLKAISEKDEAGVKTFTESLRSTLTQSGAQTPNAIKIPVMELMYSISKLKAGGMVQEEYDLVRVFGEITQAQTIDSLLEILTASALKKIDKIRKAATEMSLHVVRAISAIEQGENVTLKSLAEQYKISPVYLGQLFKNETGMLFTDYMNSVRVKKSIELLRTTDKTVAEIAELSGYASYGYFCSVFKKVTGAYPKDYRIK
ncbi:response regulator transcription factor [Eisenbergiella porci]|uniref:response regulator transcription factor n=1 Tax=Eisenbergiella porci TaxID=2652274 RepID=UPI002A81D2E4|nr:response regulator [Eisenbergiella porci]